ncbi:uncharacterized protein LOC133831919 [Humulus lupulus]|uniref:uncharacterized protein LOC133831919 n=1 Tax=Humulus lupulus TaxID=3486 RepID=UPI002B405822|nr:uncharacterized protein LOC133831919 [Humulus lupulus]
MMDKSWIFQKNRLSVEYFDGLKSFIKLSTLHLNGENKIRCPCVSCMNLYYHDLETIERHIFVKGFYTKYLMWEFHGEDITEVNEDQEEVESNSEEDIPYDSDDDEDNDDMRPALEDLASQYHRKSDFVNLGDSNEHNDERNTLPDLFAEAENELYFGCTTFSILTFIVNLMHIKKENKNAKRCPICGHERYKFQGTKGKKIPHKKMQYFPITPRLQRLFMSRHTSSDMRWHKEERVDTEGVLRQLADAEVWKDFDRQYPYFAKESRNVRLGFATDGFNPFSDLSNLYRKDIDVYLQPLIDELKELWENGVRTFDIIDKEYFTMRATILWTIHDFPAYGIVSGYSNQGYKAFPICEDDTSSFQIRGKTCFMGHRRYLCPDHQCAMIWSMMVQSNGVHLQEF